MNKQINKPVDQLERDLILSELGCNMIVEAAAGTGKTSQRPWHCME